MASQSSFVDRQLGVRVRSFRDAAGVSMSSAAVLIGCSLAEYRELEAGSKRFKALELTALADRLGVPVSEIFDAVAIPGIERLRSSPVTTGASALH
jgi:transcriptional regulator with XRE-family HTH domain